MQKPHSAPRDENFELSFVKFRPKKKVIANNIFDMSLTYSYMSSVTPIFIQYLKTWYENVCQGTYFEKIYIQIFFRNILGPKIDLVYK